MPVTSCCFIGENKPFCVIRPVTENSAGRYHCKVENQHGKTKSSFATVIITPTSTTKCTNSKVFYSTNLKSKIPRIQNDTAFTDLKSK